MENKIIKQCIFASLVLLCSFLPISCDNNLSPVEQSKRPLASVKGKTLYREDVEKVLSSGISSEDSLQIAENYVKHWIEEILIFDLAEKNILDKESVNKMVDDYRKSLIVKSYQERILRQELSKQINEEEIASYYEKEAGLFKLNDNIIKGLYLKIPVESSLLENFKKWYKQTTDDAIENLEKNALQHTVNYEYFYDRWANFDDVLDKIPLKVTDPADYLKKNNTIQVQDSSYVYLLNIKEYKTVGDEAPYEYARNKILEILSEKRKKDFMNRIYEDLYEKEMKNNGIKFYE